MSAFWLFFFVYYAVDFYSKEVFNSIIELK